MLDTIQTFLLHVIPYLLLATGILLFLRGAHILYRMIRQKNLEMALIMVIGLIFLVWEFVPASSRLDYYFLIPIGICFFILIFKMLFWEIFTEGTVQQKIIAILGILIIVLIVLFGSKIRLPAFFDAIPSI